MPRPAARGWARARLNLDASGTGAYVRAMRRMNMRTFRGPFLLLAGLGLGAGALQACSSTSGGDTGTVIPDSGQAPDSTVADTGSNLDGSPVFVNDTGFVATDTGSPVDSAVPEGSVPSDAGPSDDSAAPGDATATDGEATDAADTGATDAGGGDADCGTTPKLFAGNGTQLYCPFGPDAGAAIECTVGTQLCCVSGEVNGVYPPSTCETASDAGCMAVQNHVAGSAQIQCEDPGTDCPTGDVCCGSPDTVVAVAACGYNRLEGLAYTKCEHATACLSTELQICASTAECPSGKTCVPFKATLDLGACQ